MAEGGKYNYPGFVGTPVHRVRSLRSLPRDSWNKHLGRISKAPFTLACRCPDSGTLKGKRPLRTFSLVEPDKDKNLPEVALKGKFERLVFMGTALPAAPL